MAPGTDETSMSKVSVTYRQHEYLLGISGGLKTTRELMQHFGVTENTAYRMIYTLSKKGLVKSERMQGVRGNINIYTLTHPYDDFDLTIRLRRRIGTPHKIPDEEILYAAILRNGQMTGQQLIGQFRKVFPDRGKSSIKHIIDIARNRGLGGRWLCR